MESPDREDYEELGGTLERDLQDMEQRSGDFRAEIEEVESDWDAKMQDSSTEGAQRPEDHLVLRDRAEEDDSGSETGSGEEEDSQGQGAAEVEGEAEGEGLRDAGEPDEEG